MTPKLKPCPFCGGDAVARRREEPNGDNYAVVECMNCPAEIPIAVDWYDDVDRILPAAITAWNTRATLEPAPDAPVKALVDEFISEIHEQCWPSDAAPATPQSDEREKVLAEVNAILRAAAIRAIQEKPND